MRNQNFLARVYNKQNIEINSPASSRVEVKYLKRVSFPWPPPEATLSIRKFILLLKTIIKNNMWK